MHFFEYVKWGNALVVGAFALFPFLYMGMIQPVCYSFDDLPDPQTTWLTRVIQGISFLFKVLSISGRIWSQRPAFSAFIVFTVDVIRWQRWCYLPWGASPACLMAWEWRSSKDHWNNLSTFEIVSPRMSSLLLYRIPLWYLIIWWLLQY